MTTWLIINIMWTGMLLAARQYIKRVDLAEVKAYQKEGNEVYKKAIAKLSKSEETLSEAVLAREEGLRLVEDLLEGAGYSEAAAEVKKNHLVLLDGGLKNS